MSCPAPIRRARPFRGRSRAPRCSGRSPCPAPRSRCELAKRTSSGRWRPRGRRMTLETAKTRDRRRRHRTGSTASSRCGRGATYSIGRHLSRPRPRCAGQQHDRGRPDPAASMPPPREAAPGVLAVITHRQRAALPSAAPRTRSASQPPPPLQDDRVLHHGQYVASWSRRHAAAGGRGGHGSSTVAYDAAEAAAGHSTTARRTSRANPCGHRPEPRRRRGRPCGRRRRSVDADVHHAATNTNNPLGLFATVAAWDGDRLTCPRRHPVALQRPHGARRRRSASRESDVRVLAPYRRRRVRRRAPRRGRTSS